MNKKYLAVIVACTLGLGACQKANTIQTENIAEVEKPNKQSESEKANILFADYFDESMQMNPISATFVGISEFNDRFQAPINKQTLAKQLDFEKKYLAKIQDIDPSVLSGQDLLSYQIFLQDREMAIKGAKFSGHLIPIHQMGGAHTAFASLGSGQSAQPFNTVKDYRDFIQRSKGFATYMDSAIAAMQQGINQSIVLPKALIKKILPQLKAHMLDDVSKSVFYGPVEMLKDNNKISKTDKEQLIKDYESTIETVIIPAYSRMYQFIADTYLPNGRDTFGLNALPNGKAWYEYRIEI